MELSKLKPARGARRLRTRVGRGESSGLGKTSGRGGKGQTARKGSPIRAGFEGGQMPLYRRIPKLGFNSRKKILGGNRFDIINVGDLEKLPAGSVVDKESLGNFGWSAHLRKKGGLKLLGHGTLSKKLTVKVSAASAEARKKVEAAGGTVEIL